MAALAGAFVMYASSFYDGRTELNDLDATLDFFAACSH
jgi:hypothetical protein